MKKLIPAFAVLAIVSGALAFRPVNQGKIYCNSTCPSTSRIDFEEAASGVQDPCENSTGGEYKKDASGACVTATAPFAATGL